ncbi:MAG: hypothetical protein HDT39_00515 [Lachnospiraceae bacterium]|nr:hypothetical protein [Lachnospiraceae bacterium]
MECIKCNTNMKSVTMYGGVMPVYLEFKKKGILETEKRSMVECYVCPQCGYIELKAKNPEVFKEI